MQNRGLTRRAVLGRWVGRVALAVVVLVAALFVYLNFWRPAAVPSPAPSAATQPERPGPLPPQASARPTEELLAPEVPLPSIDESDPVVRGLVSGISANPQLSRWLVTEDLIRRFAAVVASISLGDNPSAHLEFLAPGERFAVQETETGFYVAPQSYSRYDLQADVFASLDTRGTVQLYETLHPLIVEAYRDLGYDDDFDETLALAVEHLLEVPVVQGQVPLHRVVVAYEWSDPELEGLDAAQRQFLRMGPRNVRVVQTKLRELALALGIPVQLP